MGRTRRTFTAEERLKVVMAVIQDGKADSDVAKENNIHPNMTPKLNWYTPQERHAVIKYVLAHKNFLYGYRYLDPSYQIALLLAKEDAPNCKMAVFKNTDHNFTGKLKEFIELPEKYLFA